MEIKDILAQIKKLDVVTNRNVTEVFSGNYKSSFKGRGMEIADVREYAEGDDVRHIDWMVTARQGKPFVKLYQETRELTTMVMVDLSASMNFTSVGKTKKEVALELVAVLLFSALKSNGKFGAILFTDKVEQYISPKKGKAHLLRIFREIIVGYKNNQYKKSRPEESLNFLNTIVRKQSVCFFLGDEMTETMVSPLKIANRRHDFVFCNVYDKFERGIVNSDFLEIEDPESGALMTIDLSNQKTKAQFERLRAEKLEQMKSVTKNHGIEMLDVSTEDNIYRELLLFFKKRQSRF